MVFEYYIAKVNIISSTQGDNVHIGTKINKVDTCDIVLIVLSVLELLGDTEFTGITA